MKSRSLTRLSVSSILGCILLMSGQPARADTVVGIPALQDATLFGASAANNNSSSGPGMFVGSDGAGNPKRGLIEFDVPAFVPPNATITGAFLSPVLGQVAGGGGGGGDTTPRTIRVRRHNRLGGRHQRGDHSQSAGQLSRPRLWRHRAGFRPQQRRRNLEFRHVQYDPMEHSRWGRRFCCHRERRHSR